jgi:hypothetical protein
MSSIRPSRPARQGVLLAGILVLAACADEPTAVVDVPVDAPSQARMPSPSAGGAAFVTSCAGCHASHDGFDLAYFGFPDSTIIRRAVFHVDTATALSIVQHIRSLEVDPVGRDTRPFQVPSAASDVDFAVRLFGQDAWPASLDEDGLLAIDPTRVAAAVTFPLWSDEATNLDWMPGGELPPEVLGPPDGHVERALRAYSFLRTDQAAVRAVLALRRAAVDSTAGPCFQSDDGALRDPAVCFETTRWTASLGAQHALRSGLDLTGSVRGSTAVADAFWDVGQAARRSLLKNLAPVDHAEENWVNWMYMGWVMAPGNHASGYTASGLTRAGLPRHGTFVALRSMPARAPGSHSPFADLATVARVAPTEWLADAYATGLTVLEARVSRGWKPDAELEIARARQALEVSAFAATRRLGATRAEPLVARTRSLLASM